MAMSKRFKEYKMVQSAFRKESEARGVDCGRGS
jgi:hypothetical protein